MATNNIKIEPPITQYPLPFLPFWYSSIPTIKVNIPSPRLLKGSNSIFRVSKTIPANKKVTIPKKNFDALIKKSSSQVIFGSTASESSEPSPRFLE
jgi:hypothetical protein